MPLSEGTGMVDDKMMIRLSCQLVKISLLVARFLITNTFSKQNKED